MAAGSIENRVLECVTLNYGISGSLKRLSGENLNYMLSTTEGEKYVVKIVDDDMPPEVGEMEFEAIKFALSAGFSLELPGILKSINRQIETRIKIHINVDNRLRIINYIEGIVLENISDISDILLENIGFSLARFHLAMQDFEHPAAVRNHRWNLAEAGQHRGKIGLLRDPVKEALLTWGFDAWEQAENTLKSLPWQFIHGDMNRENILIEGDRVKGLVDFGDSCINPTVCDLAICLAYIMMDRENPLETAAIVTRGYHEIRPLGDDELSVLLPLICGRLATSIAISTSRQASDPGNPSWFGNEDSAWRLLEILQSVP